MVLVSRQGWDMDTNQEPMFLTIPETARHLRKSRWAIYDLIKAGRLPVVTIGSSWRVPRAALEQLVGAAMKEGERE
jgi:excisionase family DNA binding protein